MARLQEVLETLTRGCEFGVERRVEIIHSARSTSAVRYSAPTIGGADHASAWRSPCAGDSDAARHVLADFRQRAERGQKRAARSRHQAMTGGKASPMCSAPSPIRT